jgi:hypothetical protein
MPAPGPPPPWGVEKVLDEARDFLDVALEEAKGIRVRDHDARDLLAGLAGKEGLEGVHVDAALRVRGDGDGLETGHRAGGGVGTVGGIGDEHLRALHVAAREMVGADHEDAGKLAVGAGRGLEGDGLEAADLREHGLHPVEELE